MCELSVVSTTDCDETGITTAGRRGPRSAVLWMILKVLSLDVVQSKRSEQVVMRSYFYGHWLMMLSNQTLGTDCAPLSSVLLNFGLALRNVTRRFFIERDSIKRFILSSFDV